MRLAAELKDEAQSRSLADRAGLTALPEYLKEHREVRFIVVNELERLTGDLRQRVLLTDPSQKLEVTILTEDGAVDPFDDDQ